ncbi:hypothetical protein ACLKA7_011534 [Drosophila subpalustris]
MGEDPKAFFQIIRDCAVKELKPPTNLQQLDAFMGKVNYYCNFIPNYSITSPLNHFTPALGHNLMAYNFEIKIALQQLMEMQTHSHVFQSAPMPSLTKKKLATMSLITCPIIDIIKQHMESDKKVNHQQNFSMVSSAYDSNQIFEKQTESKPMQEAEYSANQAVFAKNYARGEKWIKATIDRPVGRMLYILRTSTGFIKRHVNQIKPRSDSEDIISNSSHDNDEFWWAPESPKPPTTPTATIPEDDPQPVSSQQPQSVPAPFELPGTSQQSVQQPPQPRRSGIPIRSSTRTRQEVSRYQPSDFRKRRSANRP